MTQIHLELKQAIETLLTACSDMCRVSQRLTSDQKGHGGEQMARRAERQEVSGLDIGHSEDRAYGKPDWEAEDS